MAHSGMDLLLSRSRRNWILLTAVFATIIFSWSSLIHLSNLVDVEQVSLDTSSHSILERAEHNIASHLHLSNQNSYRGDIVATKELRTSIDQDSSSTRTSSPVAINEEENLADRIIDEIANASDNNKDDDQQQIKKNDIAQQKNACDGVNILPNTDFWGEAVVWGTNNKVNSVQECCNQCSEFKPLTNDDMDCNVFVYCGEPGLCGDHYRECWLKHLAHPEAVAPSKQGPDVGWTTGIMPMMPSSDEEDDKKNPEMIAALKETDEQRKYHVVITAQGSATHWQSRVHYYWYKKIKKQCEEEAGSPKKCHMGGFTRILHSGRADDLMKEIPTFVAKTLPKEHPHHGYIVLNRPWAFVQWVRNVSIPEKYILMSEPDHIWLKPMPNLMVGHRPAAFPFFYIEPSKKENIPLVSKFVGPIVRKTAEKIAPIGNAPTLLSWKDMTNVVPVWYNVSLAVHDDKEAVKAWGWVQEMYAFAMSLYKIGVRNVGLHVNMMSQPPFDTVLSKYYLLHYTYGMDYSLDGTFTPGKYGEWRFDKRNYSEKPPPRNLELPPVGVKNELVVHLIKALNEATNAIPGWDEYVKTGVATEMWDGEV